MNEDFVIAFEAISISLLHWDYSNVVLLFFRKNKTSWIYYLWLLVHLSAWLKLHCCFVQQIDLFNSVKITMWLFIFPMKKLSLENVFFSPSTVLLCCWIIFMMIVSVIFKILIVCIYIIIEVSHLINRFLLEFFNVFLLLKVIIKQFTSNELTNHLNIYI